MEIYGIETEWIDESTKLLKPNYERSNAGVLPAMLKHLNADNINFKEILKDKIVNNEIEKKIKQSFPEGYENIIFLLCDGIGAERLEAIGGLIWENVDPSSSSSKGTIANAVFPTMTTTNMTSLAYGMPPGDHGFVGYNIYNETINTIFNGLNGKYLDLNGEINSIHNENKVSDFVSGLPITQILINQTELPITFLVPEQQPKEGLITLISNETPLTSYSTGKELAEKIVTELHQSIPNQLITAYIGNADHFGHLFGPKSDPYTKAIREIEQLIRFLLSQPKVTNGSTLIILTSDHGQSQIDHSISRWLTNEEIDKYKEQGVTLSTSGRVIHAYCNPENEDLAKSILLELSDGKGTILSQKEALELYQGQNIKRFTNRIGQFLLLFEDGYLCNVPEVVLFGKDDKLNGQHGSLTKQELYVPVGIWGNIH